MYRLHLVRHILSFTWRAMGTRSLGSVSSKLGVAECWVRTGEGGTAGLPGWMAEWCREGLERRSFGKQREKKEKSCHGVQVQWQWQAMKRKVPYLTQRPTVMASSSSGNLASSFFFLCSSKVPRCLRIRSQGSNPHYTYIYLIYIFLSDWSRVPISRRPVSVRPRSLSIIFFYVIIPVKSCT